VSGSLVDHCVLGPEVRINSYSEVHESILFDRVVVGRKSRIRRAIIEKDVVVPEKTVLGYNLQEDARYFRVTEGGIVVVESTEKLLAHQQKI
jgi:glucose-1-phosphate adenylyltransferase